MLKETLGEKVKWAEIRSGYLWPNRFIMEQAAEYVFWICLGIIFYNYLGYGIVLLILAGIRRLFSMLRKTAASPEGDDQVALPEVTLVVAAYNEEDVIEKKIANCLSLDYPEDKLSFLFVTDGSSDRTPQILFRYPMIRLLHKDERKGKTAALNRAMAHVRTPVTIFCDANTMLNRSAIKRMVSHYRSVRTGGVAGEKRVFSGNGHTTAGMGESLYWKYESTLKRLDAALYTVTGAAGELFSIRTSLWEDLPENVILDDFVISTRINLKGYRIAYEPLAYATELPSASMGDEKKRKVRISAGAFQAMKLVKGIFNFFKHPVLSFQFFSHRILRWTLTPLSFPLLFIANILLVLCHPDIFFVIFLAMQSAFYLLSIVGISLKSDRKMLKISKICHYIFFMNYSVYLGFVRFLKGRQSVIWEKTGRQLL